MLKFAQKRFIGKYFGVFSIIAFCVSFLTGILSENFGFVCEVISDITFTFMFCFLLGMLFCCVVTRHNFSFKDSFQFLVVFGVFSAFWDIAFLFSKCNEKQLVIALLGLLVLNGGFGYFTYQTFRSKKITIRSIIKRENIGIIFVLIFYIILNIQNWHSWFRSDSYIYYTSIVDNIHAWDFTLNSISSFLMGGHTAYAYAIFLAMGEFLFPANGNGIYFINLFLALLTIYLFYKIVQIAFTSFSRTEQVLLTAVFAYSPLFLGTSYLVNTDFPMLCFFVLFVFCYFYNLKYLQWFAALAVCFSKEIGLIILLGFYLGDCISSCLKKETLSIPTFVSAAFAKERILKYSSVFIYFIPLLFSNAGWMLEARKLFQNSSEDVQLPNLISMPRYFVYKLEEIFVFHFAWILVLFLIWFIIKKHSQIRPRKIMCFLKSRPFYSFPLLCAALFFMVISLVYFTYVHYRYVQLGWFFYTLFLGYLVSAIFRGVLIKRTILAVCFCLFLTECYVTVDPLTFLTFRKVDTGNGMSVSTRRYFYGGDAYGYAYIEASPELISEHDLHEGLDHNRGILYLQNVLEQVFSFIDYDSSKLIVLDNFAGWIENDCWCLFGDNRVDGYYWDKDLRTVTSEPGSSGNESKFAIAGQTINFSDYSEIYYFDFSFNPYRDDNFLEDHAVISTVDFVSGIWRVSVSRIK